MKNSFLRHFYLFVMMALFLGGTRAWAVNPVPFTEGLTFSAKVVSGPGEIHLNIAGEGDAWVDHGTDSTLYPNPESSINVAWLRPGKTYNMVLQVSGASEYWLNFVAPSGYRVLIQDVAQDMIHVTGSSGQYQTTYSIALEPLGSSGVQPFGTFSGIQMGRAISWEMGLGLRSNGRDAGRLYFREQDLSNLADRAKLYKLSAVTGGVGGVEIFRDGVAQEKLRQIVIGGNAIDLLDDPSGGYWIRFFDRSHVEGSPGNPCILYGDPWRTIRVQSSGSGNLKMTDTEGSVVKVYEFNASGSGDNYTWTLQEGGPSGAWLRTTTQVSTPGSGQRDVVEEIRTGGTGGTLVAKNRYRYKDYAWGEDLIERETGYTLTNSVTTYFGYYTDTNAPGNYRQVKWTKDTTGNWSGFERYDDWGRRGETKATYRPWNNSPAAPTSESNTFSSSSGVVETYDYTADWTGRYNRPSVREVRINGIATGKTNWSNGDWTGSNTWDWPHSYSVMTNYRDTSTDADVSYQETYRADSWPDLAGLPLCQEAPNGGKTDWAYGYGTYNPATQTYYENGGDPSYIPCNRNLEIHGSKQAGTNGVWANSVLGIACTQIYLVPGKSTATATFISYGLLIRQESWAFDTTSTWVRVGSTDFVYNDRLRLTSSTASNGAVTTYNYDSNGLLSSVVDPSGVKTLYPAYDALGRATTVTKEGVLPGGPSNSYAAQSDLTTTLTYDALNRVRSQTVSGGSESLTSTADYDLAGRVTSRLQPGASAVTFAYDPTNRTVTTTLPAPVPGNDSATATSVKTYQVDGALSSVTGTAEVAQYLTYNVETNGNRTVFTYAGSPGSARWQKASTDWLGRTIEARRPGFSINSMADMVIQNTYEVGTGNLIKTSRTGLADTLYVYNSLGQVIRSGLDLDASGTLTTNSADRIVDADSSLESYSSNYWIKSTQTTYPVASSGTAVTTATSRVRLTGYSPTGTVRAEAQSIDAEGNVSSSVVDVSGKTVTTTVTSPGLANNQTSVVYNGLTVSSTGADNLTSLAQYDALGRAWKATDVRGNTTTISYYPNTALTYTVMDAKNQTVSTTHYDNAGQVDWEADALGQYTRYAYNARGQVTNVWGGGSYPVSYAYDATYGDRTSMSTYRGAPVGDSTSWPSVGTADTTSWALDTASGLLWKKTDAAGKIVEYAYNVRGQTSTRKWARMVGTSSTPLTTTYSYYGDTTGEPQTGELKQISYNDTGEPIPTPSVTYTYNRAGQVATVADATGTRTFNYDSSKPWRLNSEALPAFFGSRLITQLYEASTSSSGGSYGSYTKGTITGSGVGFDLGFSGATTPELHQQYTISNQGRFAGVTSTVGTGTPQDFVYNYLGNSRLVSGYTAGGNFAVARTYESKRDLVTSIDSTWAGSSVSRFDFQYNELYQKVTSQMKGSAFADYYTGTSYTSVYTYYAYNARGELQTAAMYAGAAPALGTSPSSADELPARRFEYRYDGIGNRVSSGSVGSVSGGAEGYTTNSLNQYIAKDNNTVKVIGTAAPTARVAVSGASMTTKKDRAWGADLTPGLLNSSVQGSTTAYSIIPGTGGAKDLLSTQTKSFFMPPMNQVLGYDADGNLTSDQVWTYTYNAENELVRMTSLLPSGAGFTGKRLRIDFKYDYVGRRVEKRVYDLDTSTETLARRFIYDGWNLVAELDGNGTSLKRSYTWGLDLAGGLTSTGGVGALVQIYDYTASKAYLPTYDGNGNVVSLVTAGTGALAATYEYDPYGNYLRAEVLDSAIADNPFRFSTKYSDQETGLVYYGYRYYNPTTGRFINRDPSGESGGLNLYGFAGNDGINDGDYLGLNPVTVSIGGKSYTVDVFPGAAINRDTVRDLGGLSSYNPHADWGISWAIVASIGTNGLSVAVEGGGSSPGPLKGLYVASPVKPPTTVNPPTTTNPPVNVTPPVTVDPPITVNPPIGSNPPTAGTIITQQPYSKGTAGTTFLSTYWDTPMSLGGGLEFKQMGQGVARAGDFFINLAIGTLGVGHPENFSEQEIANMRKMAIEDWGSPFRRMGAYDSTQVTRILAEQLPADLSPAAMDLATASSALAPGIQKVMSSRLPPGANPKVFYTRVEYGLDFAKELLEYHRLPNGRVMDPSGRLFKVETYGAYWEIGHAGPSYSQRVLNAARLNMPFSEWYKGETDMRMLRPELIYTNRSNKYQDAPTPGGQGPLL